MLLSRLRYQTPAPSVGKELLVLVTGLCTEGITTSCNASDIQKKEGISEGKTVLLRISLRLWNHRWQIWGKQLHIGQIILSSFFSVPLPYLALESTQSIIEINTTGTSWGLRRPLNWANKFNTIICPLSRNP